MCSSKMDTLHIMGLFNISYATYLANWRICQILRHRHVFFLSVYVRADTFTANEVKKQRKKSIINIFDLVRVHRKSPYIHIFMFFDKIDRPIMCKVFILELYIFLICSSVQNYL